MLFIKKLFAGVMIAAAILVAVFKKGQTTQRNKSKIEDEERAKQLYRNRPQYDDEILYRDEEE